LEFIGSPNYDTSNEKSDIEVYQETLHDDFQPSTMDLPAYTCIQNLIFRSGNAQCNVSSWSFQDNFIIGKTENFLLEDNNINVLIF
jgi:hypothetical protein